MKALPSDAPRVAEALKRKRRTKSVDVPHLYTPHREDYHCTQCGGVWKFKPVSICYTRIIPLDKDGKEIR